MKKSDGENRVSVADSIFDGRLSVEPRLMHEILQLLWNGFSFIFFIFQESIFYVFFMVIPGFINYKSFLRASYLQSSNDWRLRLIPLGFSPVCWKLHFDNRR